MTRMKWILGLVVVLTLPIVVLGLTQLSKNGNNEYWRCDCIGVAVSDSGVKVAGAVDRGRCIGVTVRCERCCRCI